MLSRIRCIVKVCHGLLDQLSMQASPPKQKSHKFPLKDFDYSSFMEIKLYSHNQYILERNSNQHSLRISRKTFISSYLVGTLWNPDRYLLEKKRRIKFNDTRIKEKHKTSYLEATSWHFLPILIERDLFLKCNGNLGERKRRSLI